MRIRAIKDLCQLSDPEFFAEVANGLRLIVENAASIEVDARLLAEQGRPRGAGVLHSMVEDEAAKYLMLVDAVRCPASSTLNQNRGLESFYKHLARAIYAECIVWRWTSFGELRGWIEEARESHYLDGPDGFDWIFRNRLLESREGSIYVDYVALDDDKHDWTTPKRDSDDPAFAWFFRNPPPILKLIQAMDCLGFSSPDGLAVVANLWREVEITDDFSYQDWEARNNQTIIEMGGAGVGGTASPQDFQAAVNQWPPPLYAMDLTEKKVSVRQLKEIQEARALSAYLGL